MAQFWTASNVSTTSGSAIVTVNTGDDVALISPNSFLQIGINQFAEVKIVNTSASPQTIELFVPWNNATASGQTAIAAPTKAEIKAAADEIRALRVVYEGLAGDLSVTATPDTIVVRDASSRIKTATPSAAEDAVNKGYLGTAATANVTATYIDTTADRLLKVGDFGLGVTASPEYPKTDIDTVTCPSGMYRLTNTNPSAGTRPAGHSAYGYIQVLSYGSSEKFQIATDINGKVASRSLKPSGNTAWVDHYTSGNSVNPLDFGLGNNDAPNLTDFTAAIASGHYRCLMSAATGSPDNVAYNASVFVQNGISGAGTTFLVTRTTGTASAQNMWFGSRSTLTGAVNWKELYHSGNSVNPLDYGLGVAGAASVPSMGNFNTNKVTGLYRTGGGETGSPISSSLNSVVNLGRSDSEGVTQLVFRGSQIDDSCQAFIRGGQNANFTSWKEFYHSGNAVNPKDYGIGTVGNTNLASVSIDTANKSGFYAGYGGLNASATTGDNPYAGNSGGFSVLVVKGISDTVGEYTTQTATYFAGASEVQQKIRTTANGLWGDWATMYHSDNTNFNVFGGLVAGDVIARGVAVNSTTARVYLPLNSVTAPSAMTLVSTFDLNRTDGTSLSTGVTLALNNLSSNKVAVLLIGGATGLTAGETLDLRAGTATSKITVNF